MDTEQLQTLIRTHQSKLDWSHSKLADFLYVEMNDDDDFDQQAKFRETLKKQLQRRSTSIDKLERYKQLIEHSDEFKKLGLINNRYVKSENILSTKVSHRLHKLSKKLTEQFQYDEQLSEYDES